MVLQGSVLELCPSFYKIDILFWFCLLGGDSFHLEVPCSMRCNGEETLAVSPRVRGSVDQSTCQTNCMCFCPQQGYDCRCDRANGIHGIPDHHECGARSEEHGIPAQIQGFWLEALFPGISPFQYNELPHNGLFCPWDTHPSSLLQQSSGERAKPTAPGCFAAAGPTDSDRKEAFSSRSPNFCWEQNTSSAGKGWLSHVAAVYVTEAAEGPSISPKRVSVVLRAGRITDVKGRREQVPAWGF